MNPKRTLNAVLNTSNINMSTTTLCLALFIVWETGILSGTCALAGTSDIDSFTIWHKETKKCVVANSTSVGLGSCDITDGTQWWKWGSGHRLFHINTSLCLGLAVQSKALSLLDCGTSGLNSALWWRCRDGAVYTIYQMGLTHSNGKVLTKRDPYDTWTRDGTQDSICQQPYRVVHTTNGNSAGAPCEFPFLYNGTWHHHCLPDEDSPGWSWCATDDDDTERKWGHCLKPEDGCQTLFMGAEGESCYEFVPSAAVTWNEALDSCRSQGADLLTLSGPEDLNSSVLVEGLGRMPERMWIGLHQLDTSQGWQWSDGSPLSFLRWESGMPFVSMLVESDCGVLNSRQRYETEACDRRLPYICKKTVNASRTATTDTSLYKETVCDKDWISWNGWCYKLVKDAPQGFMDAQSGCRAVEGGDGGSLASLHSFDTKEMISTNFHTDGPLDVWIGLKGTDINSTVFKWVDQAPVTFTYWGQNQPVQPTQDPSCVFYSGEAHGWKTGDCTLKRPFLCQKKGEVNESVTDAGCPPEGEWRRHGNSCYQLNPKEVLFKEHCNITIRNRFEQAFISRLLLDHIGKDTQYFWIGLQDIKNTGEYQWVSQDGALGQVEYTHWGWFEPSLPGGCVVMSTAKPLGMWEVRNCSLFTAGTICKIDIAPPPPPESEPDVTTECPDGWISRPNIKYCYKVFHEERLSRKRSWEEAERFCQALGANLPSFTKQEEMRALNYVIRDTISNDRFFWVGLNRRNPADRSWEWSDGRPVAMSIIQQDFQEDDAYNRGCAAFKTMKTSLKHLFVFLLHDFPPRPFYAKPFHCDAKLEWACQIPRGKTPSNPAWYNPGGHHDTSIFIDGHEFWFVAEPKLTFEEAKMYCGHNGSKLAAPPSFTAARQIHEYIAKVSRDAPKQNWWADMTQPGRLFPMTFTQSKYYHPTFLGRCTSISPENLYPEYMFSCQQQLPFVCERDNITSVEIETLEPHPVGLPCGNSSLVFRDKCYTLLNPIIFVPYPSAMEECKSLGGTLVTISDQVEQDFVTTLLPGMPHIQKFWIGLNLKPEHAEWADETLFSYDNFNPLVHGMLRRVSVTSLHPDDMQLCVFMMNNPSSSMMGTWDFSTCNEQQHVTLCQHYADKPEEPSFTSEPLHVNNHTFLLLHQNLTWFEAREECRKNDMDLASVAETLSQSVLTVHVSRARTPMWIGLRSEDDGIHYRWSDNSHTVFSRWTSEATSGSCVYLDTDSFWKATECEEMLEGAICHKPKHEETIPVPDDGVTVKCPHKKNGPTWIPYKKNCYSFQLVINRWDQLEKGQASDTCKTLDSNADILTIRNAEENEFVRQQLLPFKDLVQFVWLGLFQVVNDKQMKWYDGTYVQYSNWRNGRPEMEKKFMAGLNTDGVWELYTKEHLFRLFRQSSIVACKLDKEPKAEYNLSAKDCQHDGNLTYQVVTKKLSWFQAVEECRQLNGHLASVHHVQQDTRLKLIASRDGFPLWIGLSNQDASGSSYEWSDGSRYDYKAAMSGPQEGGHGSCVYITPTGGWVRTECHALVEGAICYTSDASQKAKLQVTPVSNYCPRTNGLSQWVRYEDHCYAFDMSFYNYTVYNMEAARGICKSLDAHLLTINTKEENDFVLKYMSENPLITRRIWLGMDLDKKGMPIKWLDGSDLSFSNWESGESVSAVKSEPPCAVMVSVEGGTWYHVSCEGSHSRVVCKISASSRASPVALGFLILVVVALLTAIGYIIYKKNRAGYFSSAVRYKRTEDEADTTSIMTGADADN